MARYRKKTEVTEAFQYDGDFMGSDNEYYVPEWAVDALAEGTLFYEGAGILKVKTLEGNMTVNVNDYVIRGIQGEIYPCKPDIFEKTYLGIHAKQFRHLLK